MERLSYLEQIRAIASPLRGRADWDDLISDGELGLVQALAKYQTGRGATFVTFAARRIRGAMIDGIRERLHLRHSGKQMPFAFVEIGAIEGRLASASKEASALTLLVAAAEAIALRASVARLPERERQVLTLLYFAELTLRQVGAKLGVQESRVCQLKTKALRRLRKRSKAQ